MISISKKQRDTLNAAEQIIKEHFTHKAESMLLSFHAGWDNISVCYFTPSGVQNSELRCLGGDNSFGDKLAYALDLRANENGRADQIKAERIAKLRAELAALDFVGEVA